MINAMVSNATPKAILNLCADRGIDVPKLISDVGIDQEQIKNASARIPMERMFALWFSTDTFWRFRSRKQTRLFVK